MTAGEPGWDALREALNRATEALLDLAGVALEATLVLARRGHRDDEEEHERKDGE